MAYKGRFFIISVTDKVYKMDNSLIFSALDAFTFLLSKKPTPKRGIGGGNLEEYDIDANTVATLKSLVVLYADVGDGVGGLLYEPKGGSKSAKQGTYYWLSQDLSDLLLLENSDGSCKNYTEAMIWLFADQLFSNSEYFYHALHNAGEDTHILLVDHSIPNNLTLDLTFPSGRPLTNGNFTYEEALDWLGFQFDLYIAWDKFE